MTSQKAASSSARADDAPPRSPPPRGSRAALVAFLGFLVAKTTAALLVAAPFHLVVLGFCAGFLGDVVVVAAVAAVARLFPRAGLVLAIALGMFACADVYLVVAYGSPLTAGMLVYAGDASLALVARAPLAAACAALAVFAVLAWPVSGFALARWRGRRLVVLAVLLAAAGVLARAVDTSGRLRAVGLDRNAVALLVTSALGMEEGEAGVKPVPWDDPWPAPADPAYTAPVVVDASHGRPTHVVVWLAESTAARFVDDKTAPRVSGLLDHAVRFTNYAANAPVSAKAIFGVLCGMYPSPEAAFETRTNPRIACPSLPETLAAQGWSAALFHGGYFAFTDKLQLLEERGFDTLVDGESVPGRDEYFTNGWGVDDAAVVDAGVAWLDAHKGEKTLEVFIPLMPHYEYFLPPGAARPFGERTLLDRYKNGVHYTDEQFGRVVDAYRERGILDDTLFVFLGDHGEAFEEHPRNKLHAGFLYDENVHAPLVMASTKLFPRGETSARLGSHVDLAPTILDLVGVPVPAAMQGQSLVSSSYAYRPQLLFTAYPDVLFGVRDGDLKYIHATDHDELYDLKRDPGEHDNIAGDHADVVGRYRARLADFAVRQREFVRGYPHKGPAFLDRAFASLAASVDGVACERRGARLSCGGGAGLELVASERVFNMERRCLRVTPPSSSSQRLRIEVREPVRTVGIGLTDKARFAHGAPLHMSIGPASSGAAAGGGGPVAELSVNDVFETTSKVTTLPAARPVSVDVWREKDGGDRAACLTLSP